MCSPRYLYSSRKCYTTAHIPHPQHSLLQKAGKYVIRFRKSSFQSLHRSKWRHSGTSGIRSLKAHLTETHGISCLLWPSLSSFVIKRNIRTHPGGFVWTPIKIKYFVNSQLLTLLLRLGAWRNKHSSESGRCNSPEMQGKVEHVCHCLLFPQHLRTSAQTSHEHLLSTLRRLHKIQFLWVAGGERKGLLLFKSRSTRVCSTHGQLKAFLGPTHHGNFTVLHLREA